MAFFPGHHRFVHARIVDWDPVTNTGHAQFIGKYGMLASGLDTVGTPDIRLVGHVHEHWGQANPFALRHLERRDFYAPGTWVSVLGEPSGPTGAEGPNLRAGVTQNEFKTAYYVVGALKHQPELPAHLDHSWAAEQGSTQFPVVLPDVPPPNPFA